MERGLELLLGFFRLRQSSEPWELRKLRSGLSVSNSEVLSTPQGYFDD